MLESVEIRDFKCFEQCSLTGLRRINLVVGENASGKTALLEALFLVSGGSPELYFRTQFWRTGEGQIQVRSDATSYEAVFREVFFDFDVNRTPRISVADRKLGDRVLEIRFLKGSLRVQLDEGSAGNIASTYVPLEFCWQTPAGEFRSQVTFEGSQVTFARSLDTYPLRFLSARQNVGVNEQARLFSELSKRNEEPELVEAVQAIYPWIRDLSVEIHGGTGMIFAALDGLDGKLPLTSVSGGAERLVSIALNLASSRGGVLCLDEIENGIHYKRFAEVWRAIWNFTHRYDVQLFVTTHSDECLQAMLPLIDEHPEEFCLLRPERAGNRAVIDQFDGETLGAAIGQRIEVRI